MARVTVEDCLPLVDNRFALVLLATKRTRQLMAGARPLMPNTKNKPPVLSLREIATGKVRWIFINFPLTSIHPNAVAAHELAMCAGRQGKFWEAHDVVFRTQKVWATLKDPGPFLGSLLDTLKLRKPAVVQCLEKGEARAEIQSDVEGSIRAGAQSTPTFYIEGGLMQGALPVELFRQVLDSIYRVKTKK